MPIKNPFRYKTFFDNAGIYIIALLMLAIYFSTFLTTVFLILLLLAWIISGNFLVSVEFLKQNKIILFAILLFGYFFIGVFYSSAISHDAILGLNKYRELLLIFILPALLQSEYARIQMWNVFAFASAVTLLGSYLIYFGALNYIQESDPTIKSRITHSIFISFFSFYCIHKFIQQDKYKTAYLVLFFLSVFNLFFMVSGRTGQLIFMALMLLFSIQQLTRKNALLFIGIGVFFLLMAICFSDKFGRIYDGILESQNYLQSGQGGNETSMGLRLSFWKNSLKIIAENPWFGHGTGSYMIEYGKVMAKTEVLSANPHNEYLMIAVQLGIPGLLLFLAFLYSQYHYSLKLKNQDKWLAQGILVSLVITGLFNSPIFDFAEGHWFAVMIALCFSPLFSNAKLVIQTTLKISNAGKEADCERLPS